jgi:uncharacterized membrane protein YedE/YeeE
MTSGRGKTARGNFQLPQKEDTAMKWNKEKQDVMNPYVAGLLLGLTLLAAFLILGTGLGASGAIARFAAQLQGWIVPSHTLSSEYFGPWGDNPMHYYLVFMVLGIFLGGLFSAILARRIEFGEEKGANSPKRLRTVFALCGGVLVGFASRLAGGCTSGQALTGGALLLTGSLLFMACLFASGYAMAYFVRRQWDD